MLNATTFAYDVLSRERQITRPDSSSIDAAAHGNVAVTMTSYQLGTLDGNLYLLKLVQDPRGEVRSTYRSVRQEIVAIDEVDTIGGIDGVHLTTRFAYDPLSQLQTVADANENATTIVYDTIGKMVALASPDAGRTEWRYDRAGNATVKETPNLRAAGNVIKYVFNADRLEAILYPSSPTVTYAYGDPTETGPSHGFVAGRVKTRVDESGEIDLLYDALGNVTRETTTFVDERQPNKPYVNAMAFSYDSFGRMLEIQFPGPGAEILRYGYDGGGEVTSARGLDTISKPNKPPLETVYLQHLGYDEFGQRTRLLLGNGVPTSYQYEPDTRRLSQVNTDYRDPVQIAHHVGPLPMQRLRYAYDVVGNVRTLANAVPSEQNDGSIVVGPTSFTFDYDRLYQLTHVDGTYQDHVATRLRSSLDLSYDTIGNLTQKNQQDFQDTGGANGTFQPGPARPQTTYLLGYQYAGPAPHAVSHIDEALQGNLSTPRDVFHDLDGNQTGWTFRNGTSRVQTWNEEDRLQEVKDQGHVLGHYLYSAPGVRTHSFVDGNETIYPNQYLSIRNGMFYTQHIYAGDTRIASKVNADSLNNPSTLWYHPDHLQSTQFVSASDQTLVQHFEYFASGETWKEESTDAFESFRPAYAYNGKELDTKTGYYYFGGRYYDPQVQSWESTDPALNSYISGTKAGGVFASRNLDLYTYAWNSPMVVRDPSGRTVQRDPSLAGHPSVLAALQKGTDDRVSFDAAGVLHIDSKAKSPLKHPAGTELLRRLIAPGQTVTLTKRASGVGHQTGPASITDAKGGKPTNATVELDMGAHVPTILTEGSGHKNFIDAHRPFFVGLFHELIHADRFEQGRAYYGSTENLNFVDEKGVAQHESVDPDELGTIGLYTAKAKSSDVTENKIRAEHGLGAREAVNYPPE
jgi:RHS repeat-associated protein